MSKVNFIEIQAAEKQRLHILNVLIAVAKKADRVSQACVGFPTEEKARDFSSAMIGMNEALGELDRVMGGKEEDEYERT